MACWFAPLVTVGGYSFITPFVPSFIRQRGAADQRQVALWAGARMTASGLMCAIVSPLWASLADRYGRKLMVVQAMQRGIVASQLGVRAPSGIMSALMAGKALLVALRLKPGSTDSLGGPETEKAQPS